MDKHEGTEKRLSREQLLRLTAAAGGATLLGSRFDTAQAALVRRRAELESQLEELKARKEHMPEDQYDAELEKILIEIARIGAQLRAKS